MVNSGNKVIYKRIAFCIVALTVALSILAGRGTEGTTTMAEPLAESYDIAYENPFEIYK